MEAGAPDKRDGKILSGIAVCLLSALTVASYGQTTSLPSVEQALQTPIQSSAVSASEMQRFLMARIPPLPEIASTAEWKQEEARMRQHILQDVAYHGWPQSWLTSPPRFEQVGVIETGHGYRIRKFRYEILPGFLSTALLYEPQNTGGRVPAILNLLGHEPLGTAVEYEQKRCINFAKRGIIALDLQWPSFGDLTQVGNRHDFGAQLDLVGANDLGFFYLAMRRGLDYLTSLPEVDATRIGVTGLSGGGWQTVILSALDARISASVEVAGIGSRESNLTRPHDTDEVEETAPDIMRDQDYPDFIAMRSPRPTLLIHNAEDSCCFRAPLVKPYIYDNVQPFFQLFGAADALQWHENFDPGTHNYQLDNREQAYRFFTRGFHMPLAETELFSDDEIRTPQELAIAVPPDNLTILDLARKLAAQIKRQPISTANIADEREKVKSILRYEPVSIGQALRVANGSGYGRDFAYLAYQFGFSNGLSATGMLLQETAAPAAQPPVIVLDDKGFEFAGETVAQHIDRGEQVLAVNLLFDGPAAPGAPDPTDWAMLADGAGARPLGLETAQLIAIAKWLRASSGVSSVHVQTEGIRSQVIALAAAAIEPKLFASIESRQAMRSLSFLLDTPVPIHSAPELFCLDLYKDFDIDSLQALASGVTVKIVSQASAAGPWNLKEY